MTLHSSGRAHSVEQLHFLAIPFDKFASRLVVTGEHAAQHDEIGARPERLGHVTGACTTTILQIIQMNQPIVFPANSR